MHHMLYKNSLVYINHGTKIYTFKYLNYIQKSAYWVNTLFLLVDIRWISYTYTLTCFYFNQVANIL